MLIRRHPSVLIFLAVLANQKIRECSRKRPSTERTRMFSLSPGTPGLMVQMPRTHRSTGTPAWLAR